MAADAIAKLKKCCVGLFNAPQRTSSVRLRRIDLHRLAFFQFGNSVDRNAKLKKCRVGRICGNRSGQSVFEFLAMLPLLLGITTVMMRVNFAIQSAIVNQQYARAQAFYLTYNSPYYPRIDQREEIEDKVSQMVVGVASNVAPSNGEVFRPEAITQRIIRNNQPVKGEVERQEPRQRSNVRIRNTVAMCTQINPRGRNIVSDQIGDTNFRYCIGRHDINE